MSKLSLGTNRNRESRELQCEMEAWVFSCRKAAHLRNRVWT